MVAVPLSSATEGPFFILLSITLDRRTKRGFVTRPLRETIALCCRAGVSRLCAAAVIWARRGLVSEGGN